MAIKELRPPSEVLMAREIAIWKKLRLRIAFQFFSHCDKTSPQKSHRKYGQFFGLRTEQLIFECPDQQTMLAAVNAAKHAILATGAVQEAVHANMGWWRGEPAEGKTPKLTKPNLRKIIPQWKKAERDRRRELRRTNQLDALARAEKRGEGNG